MSILQEATKYGIEFELVGDTVKVRAKKAVPPDMVEKLKEHKQEIIRTLKEQGEKVSRYCTGYKPPRWVHVDVCQWHLEQADLACADCQHLTRKEKETFMDSYLNAAIARLNAEGCRYYTPGDSAARREEIYKLERQITATFLVCNVSAFVEAVNQWGNVFFNFFK